MGRRYLGSDSGLAFRYYRVCEPDDINAFFINFFQFLNLAESYTMINLIGCVPSGISDPHLSVWP